MADNDVVKQAEIERVRVAVDEMAKLMNCRFVLDEAKLKAFAPQRGGSFGAQELPCETATD